MSDTTLRLRAVASAWRTTLLAALVVVLLVGAGGTYATHVDPATTAEERVTATWRVTGGFDHGATVTRENPVFPVGTELRNRSTYFVGASPEFDGTFRVNPNAGVARNVTATLDATLVLSSTGEEGETYWETTTDLAERRVVDVAAGEGVAVDFTVNASQVNERLSEIRNELGASPGTPGAAVAVDVSVAGTVDGERTTLRFVRRLPLSLDADTYSLAAPDPTSETVERTETVVAPVEYGPARSLGAPLLLVVGVAGLVGFLVADGRGVLELDEAERELLAFRDDRAEFDEWIVRISLPDSELAKPRAEAETLGDLVDFAIDSNTGVIEAPGGDAFHVVGDDYLFTYVPPTRAHDVEGTDADAEDEDGPDPLADSGAELDESTEPTAATTGDGRGEPTNGAPPDERG